MRSLRQDVDDLLRGEADGIGQGEDAEVAQQGFGAPSQGAYEEPWLDERDNRSDDSTEQSKHDAPLYACFTWDQWAPERTRLMEEIIPSVLLRYVHGGRAVYPQRITRPEGEERKCLNVLDFNERIKPERRGLPHHQDVWFGRARSAQASVNSYTDAGAYEELKRWYAYGRVDIPQLAPGEMATYVCTRANVVDEPALFAKTLKTSLPYRRSVRAVEEEFHALELDQHRIIGFRRDVGDLTVFAF
ncbi:uncharacterized protein SCHCODRAFT_02668879 [Schizophyllum commune H4-8]|uniref:Expressed protein n=1 Tax=Schizophyllum commune (strain H4-8 / FGSC 9210) TaxID=578458 RepID=D8Q7C6_SCHCM|nr:uncharacterized protein SCHCODRAFT_02668879 [Schizophyllum commune H4-8]KAI5891552.1 hypothetical protein SCHCODRAFT_02668879 [Schizophyllum commune H4-8]